MNIVIAGAGKLGYKLAESFSLEQTNLTIIDINEDSLENVASTLDVLTVEGNAVWVSVLEQANVRRADLFIAVTSSDEINILASSLAKRLGCEKVIARVRNPGYGNQLDMLKKNFNVDYIANPDLEMAKEVARYLLKGYSIHVENFAQGRVIMVDFRVRSLKGIAGNRICDLDLPKGTLIAAILRDNETIIPDGQSLLQSSDVIYVIGKRQPINNFSKQFGAVIRRNPVRRVMILGGGRAGYHLAHRLLQSNIQVKIIEQDRARCEYLVENLKGALVIHGDGTDRHLLAEEKSDEMDALISMTGLDEENLLLALLGKKLGISKVIAKVSRPNYVPIIEQLGIDLAVNPVLIVAGDILRFVQGGIVVSLSLLLQGQADVLEVIAQEDSQIVDKPLTELRLPKGIIIGAIVHDCDVRIPDGSAKISSGDRVIVFCLHSELATLEKLLHSRKRGILNELWHNRKSPR